MMNFNQKKEHVSVAVATRNTPTVIITYPDDLSEQKIIICSDNHRATEDYSSYDTHDSEMNTRIAYVIASVILGLWSVVKIILNFVKSFPNLIR